MSEGRGTRKAGRAAIVLACAALAALAAAPVGSAVTPVDRKAKVKEIFFKARVASDGIATPGQPETIAVSRMPARTDVRVLVEAPPTTPQCGQFYFCDPVRVQPAPGTPPFRTSGKGRALLTFVMPKGYFVETDPFDPKVGNQVDFMNGQAIHIDVDGHRLHKRVRRIGFGFARAVIQL